ncbi:MAG: efflux RND transporter periplasmic adaptor subunit [Elainellaceae cyanobacterium]
MTSDSPAPTEILDSPTVNAPATPDRFPPPRFPLGKRFNRWHLLWLLLLLPGLAIAQTQLFADTPSETATVQPLPVDTLRLQPVSTYEAKRTYSGEVVARRSSDLGFEPAGTIVNILVEEGDRVSAGQPLAQLDTRSLETERQQLGAERDRAMAQLQELQTGPRQESIAAARAAVAEIEQQLELARLQRSRREDLYQQGAISREELDQQSFNTGSLMSRLDQAQSQLDELLAGTRIEQIAAQSAQVRQLDASLEAIDIQLQKSVLTAPFDAIVSQRVIDEGVVVSSGQTVLRLVEARAPEARIGVPTKFADTLSIGSTQTIQINSQAYPAQVTALLPEVDPTSRTITVVLQLRTDAKMAIGQTAQLILTETAAADGYWLPTTALVPAERGLWSVYVLKAATDTENATTYTVARRDVEVLHTEADRSLVRGTLQPGDQAIISGTHRVVAGQQVVPAR